MQRGVRLTRIKRVRKPSGLVFVYYRRRDGGLVRLPDGPENAPAFLAAYAAASEADGSPKPRRRAGGRTLGALASAYLASPAFKALASTTQDTQRRMIRRICDVEGKGGARGEDAIVAGLGTGPINRR